MSKQKKLCFEFIHQTNKQNEEKSGEKNLAFFLEIKCFIIQRFQNPFSIPGKYVLHHILVFIFINIFFSCNGRNNLSNFIILLQSYFLDYSGALISSLQ